MDGPDIHFTFGCSYLQRIRGVKPFFCVDVQVWKDDEHVTTYKLVDLQEAPECATGQLSTVEGFAAHVSKFISDNMQDLYFQSIKASTLRDKARIAAEFDLLPGS